MYVLSLDSLLAYIVYTMPFYSGQTDTVCWIERTCGSHVTDLSSPIWIFLHEHGLKIIQVLSFIIVA